MRGAAVAAGALLLVLPGGATGQAEASRLDRVFHGVGYQQIVAPGPDAGPDARPGAAPGVPELRRLEVDELGPYWLTETSWRDVADRVVTLPGGVEGGLERSREGGPDAGVLEASPHDPGTVYHGGREVHRTTDEGATWIAIGPGALAPGASFVVLEESPLEPGVLWAGSSDGRVHVTMDNGRTWRDATPVDATPVDATPVDATPVAVTPLRVRALEPSPHEGGKAYLALEGPEVAGEEDLPLLYRTDDYGATWSRLTGPAGDGSIRGRALTVREDPELPGLLFAGTRAGIFISFDDGRGWDGFQLDLAPGAVTDVRVLGRDLLVTVEGRGIWVMRDISPLRQVLEGLAAGEPYLFAPAPAYRVEPDAGVELVEEPVNPMVGAVFDYLLPSFVRRVRIEVLDESDRVLRAFGSDGQPIDPRGPSTPDPEGFVPPSGRPSGTRSGVHRVPWDLRPVTPDGTLGAPVAPGTYRVRMDVDGLVRVRSFEVLPDPRSGDTG